MIRFVNQASRVFSQVETLYAKAGKDWPKDKVYGISGRVGHFSKLEVFDDWIRKQSAEDTGTEWATSSIDYEGTVTIKPGYKLELTARILRGEIEIPAPKPEGVFG